MTRRASVRDALVEALERQIRQFREGRDDDVPSAYLARLDDLVAGFTVILPGELVGSVLGIPVVERRGWYRLSGHDTVTAVRPARDCVIDPAARTCRRPGHDHWEQVHADAAA